MLRRIVSLMPRRDDTSPRGFRRMAPAAAAVFVVLLAYVWYASSGFANFRRLITPDNGYFAMQAEGFRHGHLYMLHTPDPRLVALPNPYDPGSRNGIDYFWDASFFRGKYYMYFSPIPILFFYLPYRLIFG